MLAAVQDTRRVPRAPPVTIHTIQDKSTRGKEGKVREREGGKRTRDAWQRRPHGSTRSHRTYRQRGPQNQQQRPPRGLNRVVHLCSGCKNLAVDGLPTKAQVLPSDSTLGSMSEGVSSESRADELVWVASGWGVGPGEGSGNETLSQDLASNRLSLRNSCQIDSLSKTACPLPPRPSYSSRPNGADLNRKRTPKSWTHGQSWTHI